MGPLVSKSAFRPSFEMMPAASIHTAFYLGEHRRSRMLNLGSKSSPHGEKPNKSRDLIPKFRLIWTLVESTPCTRYHRCGSFLSAASAAKFRNAFLSVRTRDLIGIMSEIPTITPVTIEEDTAQHRFDQVIQGVTITFPVGFAKENGS